MSERLAFPADIKSEISNLLAAHVYYQALCAKLANTLRKLEIPENDRLFAITRLLWMTFVFVQNSLGKGAGNLSESLCLLGSVVLLFLEKFKFGDASAQRSEETHRTRLLQALRLTDNDTFQRILRLTREEVGKMVSCRLLAAEWSSLEVVAHSLKKLEAVYLKQLEFQDIDMTHFLKKLARPDNHPASPLLQHKSGVTSRKGEVSSQVSKLQFFEASKLFSPIKNPQSPKVKRHAPFKFEIAMDVTVADVEAAIRAELASFFDSAKDIRDFAGILHEELGRTVGAGSLPGALQKRVLDFHVGLLKESGRQSYDFFCRVRAEECQSLFVAFSTALFLCGEKSSRASIHSLFKSAHVKPVDLLRFIETFPTISNIVPKGLTLQFLELRKMLLTLLVWTSQSAPDKTLKANPFLAKSLEKHMLKLTADLAHDLGLTRDELKSARDVMLFVLSDMPKTLHHKHVDQLILCAIYAACKIAKNKTKFRQILVAYKKENAQEFDEVAYCGATDIIGLYNDEFVPVVSAFLSRGKENLGLSAVPFSPGSPSSPLFKHTPSEPPPPKSKRVLTFEPDT